MRYTHQVGLVAALAAVGGCVRFGGESGATQSSPDEEETAQSSSDGGSTTLEDGCADDDCLPPRSCREIKQDNGAAPSGVYTIDPDRAGPAPPIKVYCDQQTDGGGWTMVFKLSSGVEGDPLLLWLGPARNENDESLLGPDRSTMHYVSSYVGDFWNAGGNSVDEARVHVYRHAVLKKFWKYDAAGTDRLDWYRGGVDGQLISSSYGELRDESFNFYGIEGDSQSGRRFYISHAHNGCANDEGWLAVDFEPDWCGWEKLNTETDEMKGKPSAPPVRILYAPDTARTNWDSEFMNKTIGVGDVFAVFVR